MELSAAEMDLFTQYLTSFDSLAGDRRTRRLVRETVRGIIGGASLCCSRIAAFPPWVGARQVRRDTGAAYGAG